jgi:hypothetical protein
VIAIVGEERQWRSTLPATSKWFLRLNSPIMYAVTPIVITEMAIDADIMFSGVMKVISVAVMWKGTSKSGRLLNDFKYFGPSTGIEMRIRHASVVVQNPGLRKRRYLYQGNL